MDHTLAYSGKSDSNILAHPEIWTLTPSFFLYRRKKSLQCRAAEGAIGFDASGATYPHKNHEGFCSFAALVYERLADDPVLMEMSLESSKPLISKTSWIYIRQHAASR